MRLCATSTAIIEIALKTNGDKFLPSSVQIITWFHALAYIISQPLIHKALTHTYENKHQNALNKIKNVLVIEHTC